MRSSGLPELHRPVRSTHPVALSITPDRGGHSKASPFLAQHHALPHARNSASFLLLLAGEGWVRYLGATSANRTGSALQRITSFEFFDSGFLWLRFGPANQGVHYLSILGREPVPILAEGILHHLPSWAAFQHRESLNQRADRRPDADGEFRPCRSQLRLAFRIFSGGWASHPFSLSNRITNNTAY